MELSKKKKSVGKKISKHILKGTMGQSLAMMNPYLLSVLGPFEYRGIKIPDDVTTHSCAFSVTTRLTIAADVNGFCGFALGQVPTSAAGTGPFTFIGSMIPGNWNDVAPYPVGAVLRQVTSASGPISSGTPSFLARWQTGALAIPNTFTNVRLVSAGLRVSYTGTVLNAQGKITTWSNPRESYGNNNDVANSGLSLGFLQQLENSNVYSVPKYGGATIVYLPQDPISRQYCPTKSAHPYNSETAVKFYGGEMGFTVDGAVSTQSFLVEHVLNYEGEPYLNTFSLTQASPSKSDPIALAHATNVISDADPSQPMTKAVTAKVKPVSTELQHHVATKEPTMMDNILGAISSVGSVAKGVMGVAKDVEPVLSTVMAML